MKKHLSNQTRKRIFSIVGMLLISVPFVLAQVLVKGTVKDNLGEGVPGASVQVKGTSQGTITDLDGKFAFSIPNKNATLVISFYRLCHCRSESRHSKTNDHHTERRHQDFG